VSQQLQPQLQILCLQGRLQFTIPSHFTAHRLRKAFQNYLRILENVQWVVAIPLVLLQVALHLCVVICDWIFTLLWRNIYTWVS